MFFSVRRQTKLSHPHKLLSVLPEYTLSSGTHKARSKRQYYYYETMYLPAKKVLYSHVCLLTVKRNRPQRGWTRRCQQHNVISLSHSLSQGQAHCCKNGLRSLWGPYDGRGECVRLGFLCSFSKGHYVLFYWTVVVLAEKRREGARGS